MTAAVREPPQGQSRIVRERTPRSEPRARCSSATSGRRWLARQPLADRARDAYRAQVPGSWLVGRQRARGGGVGGAGGAGLGGAGLQAVVKVKRRWSPTSVNQALAAIDNFYRSLGVGRPEVPREEYCPKSPHGP